MRKRKGVAMARWLAVLADRLNPGHYQFDAIHDRIYVRGEDGRWRWMSVR